LSPFPYFLLPIRPQAKDLPIRLKTKALIFQSILKVEEKWEEIVMGNKETTCSITEHIDRGWILNTGCQPTE
jgi:hypothetical protein